MWGGGELWKHHELTAFTIQKETHILQTSTYIMSGTYAS